MELGCLAAILLFDSGTKTYVYLFVNEARKFMQCCGGKSAKGRPKGQGVDVRELSNGKKKHCPVCIGAIACEESAHVIIKT